MRQETDDLSQIVARNIFAAITAGDFPEASILPNEHALGDTLGVSRTALREAIKGLSSKGMLETRRRRGTQVTDRSQWTMIDCEVIGWLRRGAGNQVSQELWEGLAAIMPEIARLAAASPQASRLGAAIGAVEDALAFATLFTELARLASNRFLASMASISLISLVRDDRAFLDSRRREMPEGGLEILRRAIVSGDAPGAAKAMQALFEPRTAPLASIANLAVKS